MGGIQQLIGAIEFAARAHRDQRRRDSAASPYINHPITLASILSIEASIQDIPTLQAAILHDTIEDTTTTYADLATRFGAEVADLVQEVTDDKALPKATRKQAQIDTAPHKTPRAANIKVADKTANLRDMADAPPHDWPLQRRREYFDWAKQVVDALPPVPIELRRLFDQAYAKRP